MAHLPLWYRVRETYAEKKSERDGWEGWEGRKGWEGRSWHRLFTQAASWCMARCWMLSVPFFRPPLAETRDNLASDQRPLRCSLKAPCYMIPARGRHESWAIRGSVTSRLVAVSTYQARTDTRLTKCCLKRLHIAQIKRLYLLSLIKRVPQVVCVIHIIHIIHIPEILVQYEYTRNLYLRI